MFSSSTKKEGHEAISTILGDETQITGEMSFKGTMRIDGHFDGNLNGDHLIISAKGKVIGDVVVLSCICHGQIRGNLTADQLQVKQGGRIDGTINADDLAVESGAMLTGEIRPKKKELRLVQDGSEALPEDQKSSM